MLNFEFILGTQYWSEGHGLNILESTILKCLHSNLLNCIQIFEGS